MTSAPARSGMPGHFGIRITDADKDKLVGELDADNRHLNNGGHVPGGAPAAFADDCARAALIVTVQMVVETVSHPLQPMKLVPSSGAAVSVTTVLTA